MVLYRSFMAYDFDITKLPEFDNHELVSCIQDEESSLKGFVAIHNTNLGPATGGTRMYEYPLFIDAVRDALALSRAMTYKCALAGLKFGGGKAVIIGNPKKKTKQLLRAYGQKINYFGGMFTTGTDSGISDKDATVMARESKYILGQKNGVEKKSTSDMAALGTYIAIRICAKELFGTPDLNGKTIAIKGLGKLGGELARLLIKDGAYVTAADINKDVVMRMKKMHPDIRFVSHTEIHKQLCDIYAPCAMGNDITLQSLGKIKTKAIAGGANNQLSSDEVGYKLHAMGILYAPDYVVNAGGLINIVDELENDGYQVARVLSRIEHIQDTLARIFATSKKKNISTHLIADQMAEHIFDKVSHDKT